jgi:ribose transport system substrate-binding protein
MIRTLGTRWVVRAAVLGVTALALTACSTAGDSTTNSGNSTSSSDATGSGSAYMVPAKTGPLTVGLANSFAGNAWRTQMVAEVQQYAKDHPDDVKSVIVTDANNSVDTQLSQINDLVTKGVDILLIDAASSSALDTAVEQAQQQGILVVSFDNPVGSSHGIVVNPDQKEFGTIGGEWLAKQLKSGDTVITLDGSAGSPVNDDRLAGAKAALEAAGIKIVGSANADWDQAKGQAAAANLLAAHPDVKGIYSQGGAMSLGAITVMQQRGGAILPVTGEGYNGFLKVWQQLNQSSGFTSIAPSNPPSLGATALDIAIKAARGTDPGQTPHVDLPVITQDDLAKTVRPDLSDSVFFPTTLPDAVLNQLFK